jgi:hydrogenase-4 component F
MISLALIAFIPLMLAVLSMLLPVAWTRAVVPVFTWLQLPVVAYVTWPVLGRAQEILRLSPDFAVDQLGALFMLLSTAVGASCLSHAAYHFQAERHDLEDGHLRVFYAAASLFILTMTAVFICDNLGALWIAVELTTLASSPLVYFDRTKHAVEATWKYLIICSVGIAFALLGTILIFASSQEGGVDVVGSMQITDLMQHAPQLNTQLLHLGVIACILGYGTKAGVFPLHNWLPDAHSEAPAPASAMLSGGLLNCALFAIWRVSQIVVASKHPGLIIDIVIAMGAITAVAASLMLLRQHSFKRMWAYSSIENVGIMLVAIGMGTGMLFFWQALNHSIAKVALFLVTGNIVQASGTKRLNHLHGVIVTAPAWGIILTLGAFAITGAPPFGLFVSEVSILIATAQPDYWPVAAALLLAVSISFVAICSHVGRIVCGGAKPGFIAGNQLASSLMPGLLMVFSFLLGILVGPQNWTK